MASPASPDDLIQQSRRSEQAGNFPAAIQQARLALQAAQQSGDREAAAQALLACAQAFFRLGNYPETERLIRQALDQAEAESAVWADGLRMLGICALETNQMETGERYLRQATSLSRQIGSDGLLVRCLHNLAAGVYFPRGQFDLALQADGEALRLCQEHGYNDYRVSPLLTMSWVCWLSAQPEACQERLAQLEQAALPGSLAGGYIPLIHAQLLLDRGRPEEARPYIEEVLSTGERLGAPELRVLGRAARSRGLRLDGEAAAAVGWAEDARRIAADIHYQHLEGIALIELGAGLHANHNLPRAAACLRAALEILDPLELHYDAARAALRYAAVLHEQRASVGDPAGEDGAAAFTGNVSGAAETAWRAAAARLLEGGFVFLLEAEPDLAGPLLAAYEAPGGPLLQRFRRTPPARLRVVAFGGLRVWAGERPIDRRDLHRRRAGELLALLLLAPGRCLPVEQILDALFPGASPEALRASFHQASSALRRALEPDLPERFPSRYLEVDEGLASFRLPPGSQVDFEAFSEHCRAQRWQDALDLAGGDFLPELLYAEWTAAPRQRLNAALQQALFERARQCLAAGQTAEAIAHCRRLLALEPWHEQAALLGMQAHLRQEDRAGARRLYHQLEKSLQADLDAVPSAEVQAFYRLLDRRFKA